MADTTAGHSRRRTADAKISPSADGQGHLSDWLSKIKQIQEETDKGDEAVRKDLQEEIYKSRKARTERRNKSVILSPGTVSSPDFGKSPSSPSPILDTNETFSSSPKPFQATTTTAASPNPLPPPLSPEAKSRPLPIPRSVTAMSSPSIPGSRMERPMSLAHFMGGDKSVTGPPLSRRLAGENDPNSKTEEEREEEARRVLEGTSSRGLNGMGGGGGRGGENGPRGMSLASFMGGRGSGPLLNRPSPTSGDGIASHGLATGTGQTGIGIALPDMSRPRPTSNYSYSSGTKSPSIQSNVSAIPQKATSLPIPPPASDPSKSTEADKPAPSTTILTPTTPTFAPTSPKPSLIPVARSPKTSSSPSALAVGDPTPPVSPLPSPGLWAPTFTNRNLEPEPSRSSSTTNQQGLTPAHSPGRSSIPVPKSPKSTQSAPPQTPSDSSTNGIMPIPSSSSSAQPTRPPTLAKPINTPRTPSQPTLGSSSLSVLQTPSPAFAPKTFSKPPTDSLTRLKASSIVKQRLEATEGAAAAAAAAATAAAAAGAGAGPKDRSSCRSSGGGGGGSSDEIGRPEPIALPGIVGRRRGVGIGNGNGIGSGIGNKPSGGAVGGGGKRPAVLDRWGRDEPPVTIGTSAPPPSSRIPAPRKFGNGLESTWSSSSETKVQPRALPGLADLSRPSRFGRDAEAVRSKGEARDAMTPSGAADGVVAERSADPTASTDPTLEGGSTSPSASLVHLTKGRARGPKKSTPRSNAVSSTQVTPSPAARTPSFEDESEFVGGGKAVLPPPMDEPRIEAKSDAFSFPPLVTEEKPASSYESPAMKMEPAVGDSEDWDPPTKISTIKAWTPTPQAETAKQPVEPYEPTADFSKPVVQDDSPTMSRLIGSDQDTYGKIEPSARWVETERPTAMQIARDIGGGQESHPVNGSNRSDLKGHPTSQPSEDNPWADSRSTQPKSDSPTSVAGIDGLRPDESPHISSVKDAIATWGRPVRHAPTPPQAPTASTSSSHEPVPSSSAVLSTLSNGKGTGEDSAPSLEAKGGLPTSRKLQVEPILDLPTVKLPSQPKPKVATLSPSTFLSIDIFSVTGTASTTLKPQPKAQPFLAFEGEVVAFVCRAKAASRLVETKLYSWHGKDVNAAGLAKVKDLERQYRTIEVSCRQGHESADILALFGGSVVIRQGTRQHHDALNSCLLCCRETSIGIFIDEVPLLGSSFCSAYSYVTSLLDNVYVWHGRGSLASERGAAVQYGQTLTANGEVQEFEEGDEPTDFLEMLDIDPEDRSSYAKADYWRHRGGHEQPSDPCIFTVNDEDVSQANEARAIDPGVISIVSTSFENSVIVPAPCRGRRRDIATALAAANVLHRVSEGRSKASHVLIFPSSIPRDLRASFRTSDLEWDKLNGLSQPDGLQLNIHRLDDAISQLAEVSFSDDLLRDPKYLPVGIAPEHLV